MIKIKVNTKNVEQLVKNIANKKLPAAIKNSLNDIGFKVKDDEVKALKQYLDKPIPFTEKGYEVVKATDTNHVVTVQARPIQEKYLAYAVDGGSRSRSPKGKVNIVPTGKQYTNQYGNVPKGVLRMLLRDKKRFFSGAPRGRGSANAGIYQRIGDRVKLMIAYEGTVTFKKRLPFEEVARESVAKNYLRIFAAKLGKSL